MQSEVVLFGQANNLSTQKMAELRHKLREHNLFLKFPKPGILRALIKQSQWSSLEPIVVGPTFCAVSKSDPSSLKEAFKLLNEESRLVILGGKLHGHEFTIDGVKELIAKIPSLDALRYELVSLLQSVSGKLVDTCQAIPSALLTTLQSHKDASFKE